MLRLRMFAGVALAALAIIALPVSSFAFIQYFVAEGQGGSNTTNLNSTKCQAVGLICNNGDVCQCIETSNVGGLVGTLGGLNGGAFDLLLSVDATSAVNDGTGRSCFAASGEMFLTSSDTNSVLTMETTGWACNGPFFDFGLYTGAYVVVSGSGQFYRTSGTGTLSWADQFSNSSSLVQVTGNISNSILPGTVSRGGTTASQRFFQFVWPPSSSK